MTLPSALAWLTPSEHQRWQGFGLPPRRQVYLAGRWQLRCELAMLLGGEPEAQPVDLAASGATTLPGTGLHANLSHSGGWLAVAIGDAPVGVDIEQLNPRRDVLGLAQMVCSPAQVALLQAQPDTLLRMHQFYRWWTLKEAWLKHRGLGLQFPTLQSLAFDAAGPDIASAASGLLTDPPLAVALVSACPLGPLPALPTGTPWQRLNPGSPPRPAVR
ncbi:MAG TPA: 4'-phosphopantetheinyl transferase superfamily protein [Ideonella sp.]|uniref:4'-phosphopantetheinyl transferase family protein n=1 Tax=Ideonella sp. TaxID=1929293 RepID=UPI002CAB5178|nr:4'-phosphopantetheinyl transferase superfamily protein [Ideonella sp.]